MAEQSMGRERPLAPGARMAPAARWLPLVGLLAVAMLLSIWRAAPAPTPVVLDLNGQLIQSISGQPTVGAFLREQGYALAPQDILYPPRATPLSGAGTITLLLARDMTVAADGRYERRLTHAERVSDLLRELGVTLGPGDEVQLDGLPVSLDARLPLLPRAGQRPRGELRVARALPIEVEEDGALLSFHTRATTLGEALVAQNVLLYEGDYVSPPLDSPVTAGMRVRIQRTTPVVLRADGRTSRPRTGAATVGELLAQQGLAVRELDRVSPPLGAPLASDMEVTITRVDHQWLVEREPIPFERRVEPVASWELDTQGLAQAGAEGSYARETLVIFEDGQERERILQREYVEAPPRDEIYGYGTKVVVRTINTPEGPRQYWRRIRMHATSYTAATSGKSRDHPAYGITRTGVQAGFGIVAVDPRVVDLRSSVYVPGYGVAFVGDTGGAIKGRRIDLGYDEWNLRLWYGPVDVYLLTPVPPPAQIRYILP